MATQEATLTTQEVANRFYQLAQENKFDQIQDELRKQVSAFLEPVDKPAEAAAR